MEKQRRLRTWLENIVNSGKIENLEWVNRDRKIFRIPWKHESRNDWDPTHAQIFTEWARFTGKYREGIDKPDYKMFKTRLRCAFNKAPDIEEIVEMRKYKGATPFRVYQLLAHDKKPPPRKTNKHYEHSMPVVNIEANLPPLVVEQLAEKSRKTIDLFQAVEAEREQQKREEAAAAMRHVIVKRQDKDNLSKKDNQEPEKTQICSEVSNQEVNSDSKAISQKIENLESNKDDPASQSLILLQSTRYRCTLLKNLFELQKGGILCDLLLKAKGGHAVPVHANVLCASSAYFKHKVDHWDVGHSGDTEGGCMVINFFEVRFEVLTSIIQFIYMGEFEVARMYLPEVQDAADLMKLEDLSILCEHVLKALRANLTDEKNKKPMFPVQPPLSFNCITSEHNEHRQPTLQQQGPLVTAQQSFSGVHLTTSAVTSRTTVSVDSTLQNNSQTKDSLGFQTIPVPRSSKIENSVPNSYKIYPSSSSSPTTNEKLKLNTRADSNKNADIISNPVSGTKYTINITPTSAATAASGGVRVIAPLPSWHIPQAEATPNPLDVLCQAVDETIRSEGQSEGEDSQLVGDERLKTVENNLSAATGLKKKLPSVIPVSYDSHHKYSGEIQRQKIPLQPLTISTDIFSSESNRADGSPPAIHIQPPLPQVRPYTVQPVSSIPLAVLQQSPVKNPAEKVSQCSNEQQRSTYNVDNKHYGTQQLNSKPVLIIPTSVINPTPTELLLQAPEIDDGLLKKRQSSQYQEDVLSVNGKRILKEKPPTAKILVSSTKQQHNIKGSSDFHEPRSGRKHSTESSISDEEIQSIINRIKKSQTNEELEPRMVTDGIKKVENGRKHGSSGPLPKSKRVRKSMPEKINIDEVVVIEDDEGNSSDSHLVIDTEANNASPDIYSQITVTPVMSKALQNGISMSIPPVSNLPSNYSKTVKEKAPTSSVSIQHMDPAGPALNIDVEKTYSCKTCKITFSSSEKLKSHTEKCNRKYVCNDCGNISSSINELLMHKKNCSVPTVILDHICDQCGKMFSKEAELNDHIQKHEITKINTCKVCKKVCQNNLLLRLHLQLHANSKLKFSCIECGKKFLNRKKLEFHEQIHVQRMKKKERRHLFKCDICKTTFKNKGNLILHIDQHEKKKDDVIENNIKKQEIKSSVQIVNENDICKNLINTYSRSMHVAVPSVGELTEGMRRFLPVGISQPQTPTDIGEKEIGKNTSLLQCSAESDKSLSKKEETVSETALSCCICDENFADYNSKKIHLMTHFQVHPDLSKVICQVCSADVHKEDIDMHEKNHVKYKPLQCPHCNGRFDHAEELNTHVIEDHQVESVGTVSERFCEHCDMRCTSLEDLQEHMSLHLSARKKPKKNSTVSRNYNQVFSDKNEHDDFQKHVRTSSDVLENRFHCRFCDKNFNDESSFSIHEKKEHQKEPLSRRSRRIELRATKLDDSSAGEQYVQDPTNGTNIIEKSSFNNGLNTSNSQSNHTFTTTPSGPPPLVNLNMLSEEVKRQFFPALAHKKSTSLTVMPHGSDPETSDEEDLSIMVALKGRNQNNQGRQLTERHTQMEEPFVLKSPQGIYSPGHAVPPNLQSPVLQHHPQQAPRLPPAYNQPMYFPAPISITPTYPQTTFSTNPNVLNGTPAMASSVYSGSRFPTRASTGQTELLTQIKSSRNPSELVKTISLDTINMSNSFDPSPQQIYPRRPYNSAGTSLARVGGQLKLSKKVAPQVRSSLPESESVPNKPVFQQPQKLLEGKHQYPLLPKKRPIDPLLLQNDYTEIEKPKKLFY